MEIRGPGETTWGVCGWDCKYITYLPAFLLRNSVVYRFILSFNSRRHVHFLSRFRFLFSVFSFHTHNPRKREKENLTFSLFSLLIHRHTLNPSSSGFTTTTPSHPPPPPSNSAASTPTTSTNSASEIPTNGLPGTTSPSQTDIISSELSNPCREEENLARSCWRG